MMEVDDHDETTLTVKMSVAEIAGKDVFDDFSYRDAFGNNALHRAVILNDSAALERMSQQQFSERFDAELLQFNIDGCLPLHLAVALNRIPILRLLFPMYVRLAAVSKSSSSSASSPGTPQHFLLELLNRPTSTRKRYSALLLAICVDLSCPIGLQFQSVSPFASSLSFSSENGCSDTVSVEVLKILLDPILSNQVAIDALTSSVNLVSSGGHYRLCDLIRSVRWSDDPRVLSQTAFALAVYMQRRSTLLFLVSCVLRICPLYRKYNAQLLTTAGSQTSPEFNAAFDKIICSYFFVQTDENSMTYVESIVIRAVPVKMLVEISSPSILNSANVRSNLSSLFTIPRCFVGTSLLGAYDIVLDHITSGADPTYFLLLDETGCGSLMIRPFAEHCARLVAQAFSAKASSSSSVDSHPLQVKWINVLFHMFIAGFAMKRTIPRSVSNAQLSDAFLVLQLASIVKSTGHSVQHLPVLATYAGLSLKVFCAKFVSEVREAVFPIFRDWLSEQLSHLPSRPLSNPVFSDAAFDEVKASLRPISVSFSDGSASEVISGPSFKIRDLILEGQSFVRSLQEHRFATLQELATLRAVQGPPSALTGVFSEICQSFFRRAYFTTAVTGAKHAKETYVRAVVFLSTLRPGLLFAVSQPTMSHETSLPFAASARFASYLNWLSAGSHNGFGPTINSKVFSSDMAWAEMIGSASVHASAVLVRLETSSFGDFNMVLKIGKCRAYSPQPIGTGAAPAGPAGPAGGSGCNLPSMPMSLAHDYIVGKLLNAIRPLAPNFCYTYAMFSGPFLPLFALATVPDAKAARHNNVPSLLFASSGSLSMDYLSYETLLPVAARSYLAPYVNPRDKISSMRDFLASTRLLPKASLAPPGTVSEALYGSLEYDVVSLVVQVVNALSVASQWCGFVHFDLKDDNILLQDSTKWYHDSAHLPLYGGSRSIMSVHKFVGPSPPTPVVVSPPRSHHRCGTLAPVIIDYGMSYVELEDALGSRLPFGIDHLRPSDGVACENLPGQDLFFFLSVIYWFVHQEIRERISWVFGPFAPFFAQNCWKLPLESPHVRYLLRMSPLTFMEHLERNCPGHLRRQGMFF